MFIGDCSIANYADDTTPYALGKNLDSVISKLEDDFSIGSGIIIIGGIILINLIIS